MRILAALLFAAALVQPALAERRVALVVGNDSYDEVTGLKKAVSDAHALADALKPLGFEVDVVDNASRSTLSRHMVDFERRVQPGDTALFFFAGHGVEIRGENYLLPTDVPNAGEGQEGLVRDSAFSANDIISRIQSRGAGRVIAVLDACRNNPFEPSLGTRALGGGSSGLAGMEASEGVFVLLSAGAKQEALDTLGDSDGSPNSIFTRALIKSLSTPGLSLVQIAKQTQTEVDRLASAVDHEQTPAYSDNIKGDLVLLPAAAVAEPALPPPPAGGSATADLAAWKTIESSQSPEDFAAYLDRFGANAIFAGPARERIAALALGAAGGVPPAAVEEDAAATPPVTNGGGQASPRPTPGMDDPGVGGSESAAIEPEGPSAEGAPPEPPSGLGRHDQMLPGTAGEELTMAPNGERVAAYSSAIDGDGGPAPRIRVWSGAGELVSEIQQEIPVEEIVFSPDGSLLASVEPTRIRVFDTVSGSLVHEFPGEAAAFSPNGKKIVISGRGFVNLYDAVSGGEPQKLDIEPLVPADVKSYPYFITFDNLTFNPDGTFLSFEYYQTGSVDRGKVTRPERPNHRIQTWSFFDDSFPTVSYSLGDCGGSCEIRAMRFFERLLVVNNGDRDVFVFDRETGEAVSTLSGRLVLLARHGENPAAMVAERDHVRIYDLVTGDLVQDVVSLELASARVSDDLRLGARRGPNGSWLIFPAQGGAMAAQ